MRVLCCGTFDYLHPGHLSFIEQAAALGDELFAVVARDENVKIIKGHYPDHSEVERKATDPQALCHDVGTMPQSLQSQCPSCAKLKQPCIAAGTDT